MKIYLLDVPMVPPSPNETKRKYRNPHVYRKLRAVWEQSLFVTSGSVAIASAIRRMASSKGRICVSVMINHRGVFDPDNLVGSVKICLDALKNIGFIRNDRRKDIVLTVDQAYSQKESTVITLQREIEPGSVLAGKDHKEPANGPGTDSQ